MFIRREHWSRKSRRTYAAVVSSEWKLLTSCSSGLQICLWKTISLPQTSLTPIVLSLLFPMRAIEPAQPCDLSPPRASKALLPRLLLRHVNDAQDRLHVYVNNNNVNSAPLLSFSSISGYETSATVTQRFTGGMSDEGVLCEELYFAAAQMHWSTNSVLVRLQCTYHLPILSMTNASFVICFLFLLGPHHEFLGSVLLRKQKNPQQPTIQFETGKFHVGSTEEKKCCEIMKYATQWRSEAFVTPTKWTFFHPLAFSLFVKK